MRMHSHFFAMIISIFISFYCYADEGIQISYFSRDNSSNYIKSQKLILSCGQYQIQANIVFYSLQEQDEKITKLTQSFAALIKNRTVQDVAQYSHIYFSENNDFSCRYRPTHSIVRFHADGSMKIDQARSLQL